MVCEFLAENGANVNFVNEKSGDTLLHILAQSTSVRESIYEWAKQNIEQFEVNAIDLNGK